MKPGKMKKMQTPLEQNQMKPDENSPAKNRRSFWRCQRREKNKRECERKRERGGHKSDLSLE